MSQRALYSALQTCPLRCGELKPLQLMVSIEAKHHAEANPQNNSSSNGHRINTTLLLAHTSSTALQLVHWPVLPLACPAAVVTHPATTTHTHAFPHTSFCSLLPTVTLQAGLLQASCMGSALSCVLRSCRLSPASCNAGAAQPCCNGHTS